MKHTFDEALIIPEELLTIEKTIIQIFAYRGLLGHDYRFIFQNCDNGSDRPRVTT